MIVMPPSMPPILYAPPPIESKCPNCGKDEKTKTVCSYCGYEYKKSNISFKTFFFTSLTFLLISVFLFWFLWTTLDWLSSNVPLIRVLKNQIEWFENIKIIEEPVGKLHESNAVPLTIDKSQLFNNVPPDNKKHAVGYATTSTMTIKVYEK